MIVASAVGIIVVGGALLGAYLANRQSPKPVAVAPQDSEVSPAAESNENGKAPSPSENETPADDSGDPPVGGGDSASDAGTHVPDTPPAAPADSIENDGESAATNENDRENDPIGEEDPLASVPPPAVLNSEQDEQDGLLGANPMANRPPLLPAERTDSPLKTGDILDGLLPQTPELGELDALLAATNSTVMEIEDLAAGNEWALSGVPRYFIERPAPETVILERQWNLPVKGIRYQDIPLIDVASELTLLGSVPLSFDADSLRDHGIDFRQPVTVDLTDTTWGEVVSKLAVDVGLVEQTHESPPLVELRAADASVSKTDSYSLADLGDITASPETIETFMNLLPQLTGPVGWPEDPRQAMQLRDQQLEITAPGAIHARLREMFSKLAAVHQLNQDPNRPEAIATLATRSERIAEKLSQPLTGRPTLRIPLVAATQRIHAKTGITVLLDWSALIHEGWTPDTEIPGNISEPDVRTLFLQIAHAMGLVFRAIDDSTVELTTPTAAAQRTDLEVYACQPILQKGISPEKLNEYLFGNLLRDEIQTPHVRIVYQPELQCLIAIGPQTLHDRIAPLIRRLAK